MKSIESATTLDQVPKILESSMKIRFHDCDPFKHLNNSRYIDYILTARGDQLAHHYGLDIDHIAMEQGIGWVTAQTQIAYLSPALLMEEVIIQTRLIDFSEKTLQLEAIMWDKQKSSIKAIMWTRFVHFHLIHQKSQRHPENLMNLFKAVVHPLPTKMNFDERIQSLKTAS